MKTGLITPLIVMCLMLTSCKQGSNASKKSVGSSSITSQTNVSGDLSVSANSTIELAELRKKYDSAVKQIAIYEKNIQELNKQILANQAVIDQLNAGSSKDKVETQNLIAQLTAKNNDLSIKLGSTNQALTSSIADRNILISQMEAKDKSNLNDLKTVQALGNLFAACGSSDPVKLKKCDMDRKMRIFNSIMDDEDDDQV